ncbi:hypothetical protein AVEN_223056-1 [Araneus ventricosus]|uniref:Uncharacterized protein n=1 Tax=Araneus ventricosus TaxID=182803 RepID=A0A4Y2WSG3_ARAVE|nr:hypothetical protein AVEN_113101-1 [Araneus ventricosus]GBO38812.1 hypothetical protein AVEN_223056-1 [Araneus ventricosus]
MSFSTFLENSRRRSRSIHKSVTALLHRNGSRQARTVASDINRHRSMLQNTPHRIHLRVSLAKNTTAYFMGPLWPYGKVRLRVRRAPGSKPDSTEDSQLMRACCTLSHTYWVKHSPSGVVQKIREEELLKCRPRHLTAVQNFEVRPK